MATWTCRALAILGCALAAAPTLCAEKSFDRHFSALAGGQLAVDADVGSVAIVGRDARELIVHVDMTGSDSFLARLDVSAVQNATGVIVTERVTHRRFADWFDFTPQNVRFTIEVPRDYPVTVHTSGGSLDVSHLKAPLHGRTFGGSITLNDVFGSIDTHTFGGSIDATELNGSTELRTFGGSIDVAHSTGDLDVHTAGGGIRLDDIDGRVTARTSGGSVIAKMRANRGMSLRTSGGGITLLLPADVRASIDAHTSGGSATSTIPLSSTRIAAHGRLRGDINGGGESIFLRTFGGGIQIAPSG
jgi:DUF4097 and DUF4098 domain-containing protein YvlB